MRRFILFARCRHCLPALLCGVLTLAAIGPTRVMAQGDGRVFALIAIDTDANIAGLEDDERAMSAALESGFGNSGLLNLRSLKGADLSPNAIVNSIRRAPLGPNVPTIRFSSITAATAQPSKGGDMP
jgi:hypothetical protein